METASEKERQVVESVVRDAQQVVPGLRVSYVARVDEPGERGLLVGVKLPAGVTTMGAEFLALGDAFERAYDSSKLPIGVTTNDVRTGKLLRLDFLPGDVVAADAPVRVPINPGLTAAAAVAVVVILVGLGLYLLSNKTEEASVPAPGGSTFSSMPPGQSGQQQGQPVYLGGQPPPNRPEVMRAGSQESSAGGSGWGGVQQAPPVTQWGTTSGAGGAEPLMVKPDDFKQYVK